MNGLVDLSIRRSVFTLMLMIALVGMGLLSLGRIGVGLFPTIELPYVSVTTLLEGASPETVELEITDVLEEQINTIEGIDSIRSFSAEGVSQILIEFALEADIHIKAQDVRDKVQLALADLPTDIDPPIVDKVDPDAQPIITVLIAGNQPIGELTDYADRVVKQSLQRIQGVGSVSLVGGRDRAMRIWADNQKLRAHGVTIEDLRRAVQTEHAELPGGKLEIGNGAREVGIKTVAEAFTPNDFLNLPVAYRDNGVTIRISDIAHVETGLEDEKSAAFLNGQRGIALDIRKQSGQNTVAVSHEVKAKVAELEKQLPDGMSIIVTRDTSKFIESSVEDVSHDVLIAIFLVTAVTFIFLLNVRSTLIVALAIPTSLISSFFCFYIMGFTINILSLLALTVAIGLLVDDAIVVVESISQELEAGVPPFQAALDGTRKVGLAVLAGTAATLAVFIPIAFTTGMVGRMFFQYGLTIVFSVSVSLLVAITLAPMLASRLLKYKTPTGWAIKVNMFWDQVSHAYSRLISWAIRWRYVVIVLAIGSVFLGGWYASQISTGFLSKADRSEFLGSIELPQGTGISASQDIALTVTNALLDIEFVDTVFISAGGGDQGKSNLLSLYVEIAPKQDRNVSQFEIMDSARQAIANSAPMAIKTAIDEVPWVTGTSSGGFDFDLIIMGPDLDQLAQYSESIMRQMEKAGSFADPRSSYEGGRPEAQIIFDRIKAGDQAVSAKNVSLTSRIAISGMNIATYESQGRRYDVRLSLQPDQKTTARDIEPVQVSSRSGRLVDIGSVSEIIFDTGPSQIDRYDRERKISIFASAATGVSLGDGTDDLLEILNQNPPPKGITFKLGGMAEYMEETAVSIGFAMLLAFVCLYMVLASQFNSMVQPLIIMVTAPLSFSGAFASLYYFGLESSIFAQIGLIGLMGIVMKNGILLVDRANQLILDGIAERAAIQRAGPERLRPVLMTAISAVFGMIPVALATSDGSEWRNALGALIIGGLATSTLLTLVVVPAAFMIPKDVSNLGSRVKKYLVKGQKPAGL